MLTVSKAPRMFVGAYATSVRRQDTLPENTAADDPSGTGASAGACPAGIH